MRKRMQSIHYPVAVSISMSYYHSHAEKASKKPRSEDRGFSLIEGIT